MPTRPADPSGDPARPELYPVSLVVAGRPCLVVGGGSVAARKAAGLLHCGARVTIVAPRTVAAIDRLAGRGAVDVLRRPYLAGEAAGYRLVVTATGVPAVDRAVAADADAAGVWVNSADNADQCTFMLPAVHRDGRVTVAVSSGGASPALASWLRNLAARTLPLGAGDLAELLDSARRSLQSRGVETSRIDWHALLDGPLPGLVAAGRTEEALRLVEQAALGAAEGTPAV